MLEDVKGHVVEFRVRPSTEPKRPVAQGPDMMDVHPCTQSGFDYDALYKLERPAQTEQTKLITTLEVGALVKCFPPITERQRKEDDKSLYVDIYRQGASGKEGTHCKVLKSNLKMVS